MNFWQSIKQDKLLLCALILAFLLRTLNPTFGSPSLYISNDEAIAHLSALNMIAQRTPVSIANYTPLGAYIQIPFLAASFLGMKILGLVNSTSDFELFLLTHEGYFLFIPRLISALFGTLTILIIYRLTLLLFNKKEIALICAYLSAVSFNLVHISHFGKPWAPALFFMTLALYLALRKRTVSSFITAGVAYGFHQVGIFILPLLLALTYKNPLKQIQGLTIFVFLFFILNKLTLKSGIIDSIAHGQSFLNPNTIAGQVLSGQPTWQSLADTFTGNISGYFAINFLVTDGVILTLGLLGLWKVMPERQLIIRVIPTFITLYFVFASLFFYPLLRYLLPIIILFIPLASYGLSKIQSLPKIVAITILLVASINSLWWNWLYLKTPTFIQAHHWLNKNIPAETPIAYVGGRFQTFVPSTSAIRHMQTVNPNIYKRLASVPDKNNHNNMRNIVYISKFPGRTKLEQMKNGLANYHVEYIVDYYLDEKERLFNLEPELFELVTQIKPIDSSQLVGIPEPLFDPSWNFPTNDPRPKVSMYSLERIGPYFDILKIKSHWLPTKRKLTLPLGE